MFKPGDVTENTSPTHNTPIEETEQPQVWNYEQEYLAVVVVRVDDWTVFEGRDSIPGPVLFREDEVLRPTWERFEFLCHVGHFAVHNVPQDTIRTLTAKGLYNPHPKNPVNRQVGALSW